MFSLDIRYEYLRNLPSSLELVRLKGRKQEDLIGGDSNTYGIKGSERAN